MTKQKRSKAAPIYFFIEFKSWKDSVNGRVFQLIIKGLPVMTFRWNYNPPWLPYAKYRGVLGFRRVKKGFHIYPRIGKLHLDIQIQKKTMRSSHTYEQNIEVRGIYNGDYIEVNKGFHAVGERINLNCPNGAIPKGTTIYLSIPRDNSRVCDSKNQKAPAGGSLGLSG